MEEEKIKQLEAQLALASADCNRLMALLKNQNQEIEDLKKEKSQLRAQLDIAITDYSRLMPKLAKYITDCRRLMVLASSLSEDLDEKDRQLRQSIIA